MNTVFFLRRVGAALSQLDERLSRYRHVIGGAFALLLAAGFALLSVNHGPLYNLNDIGTFQNRALFIVMTCAGFFLLLLLTTALHRGGVYRLLLREGILFVGLWILLVGINQQTYFYGEEIRPMIRAMDAAGLGALAQWETTLTAPMATLLYVITRGAVYDLYTVKLACVLCFMLLGVLAMHAADVRNLGIRVEALLALCMILPCGFMSAACTALPDVIALAPLAAALMLAMGAKRPALKKLAAALYGLALALGGLALYALPIFVLLVIQKKFSARDLALSAAVALAACVPAVVCGMSVGKALYSLFAVLLALPTYAAGAPGMFSLIPRALVEEMPGMFQLQYLPEIDTVTNAQKYYTQAHFEQAALGFAIAGIAMYVGVFALVYRRKDMSGAARAFALTLMALIVCPGVTNGAWLAAAVLALYIIMTEKRLRLAACMVIFSVCGAAAYPMLEETLLPMATAFVLNLCALCMVLDVIPGSMKDIA